MPTKKIIEPEKIEIEKIRKEIQTVQKPGGDRTLKRKFFEYKTKLPTEELVDATETMSLQNRKIEEMEKILRLINSGL